MNPLPTQFDGRADQKGFQFSQIKREGDVALFEKRKPGWLKPKYEVVIVQKCPERTWPNGLTTPAHEIMPSPEEWGTLGWSPATLCCHARR